MCSQVLNGVRAAKLSAGNFISDPELSDPLKELGNEIDFYKLISHPASVVYFQLCPLN